jgi:hypothetical protein
MTTPIVRSRLALPNPRFKRALLGWIDRFIAGLPTADNLARQFKAESARRQAEALGGFRAYLSELEHDDPRYFQLAEATGRRVGAKSFAAQPFYEPTPSARRLFYEAGLGAPTPPAATLDLLVSATVADVTREYQSHVGTLEQERKAAFAERDKAQARAAELEAAATERTALAAQLERANRKAERQRARTADLEGFLATIAEDKRRILVEGEKGIYQAPNKEAGQLVYEIGYREDGKQRWKRLAPGASIEDARAERARLVDPEHGGDADEEAEASQDAGAGDGDQQTTTEPVAAGQEA